MHVKNEPKIFVIMDDDTDGFVVELNPPFLSIEIGRIDYKVLSEMEIIALRDFLTEVIGDCGK